MKEFGGDGGEDFFAPRTAEVRPAPGYRMPVKKPQSVRHNAERANAMIRLYGAGKVGEAVAMAEEDRARRAEQTRRLRESMTPAQLADLDDYARRVRSSSSGKAWERPVIVVHQGKEMHLADAISAGYVPTGNEGKRED